MINQILSQIIEKEFKTDKFEFNEVSNKGKASVFIVKVKSSMFVVRITDKPYSLPNNAYALKLLVELNISPKLIVLDKIDTFEYSIETYLFGETVKDNSIDISKLAEVILKLHTIKSSKCGYLNSLNTNYSEFCKNELILKYSNKFKEKVKNGEEIINYLLENISKELKFTLLHGDLNPDNNILNDNKYNLFDFEGCIYGEKEYDIGYLHFRVNFTDGELNEFMRLTKYNKNKILYYALCVGMRKVALAKENELKERTAKLIEIYEKIK